MQAYVVVKLNLIKAPLHLLFAIPLTESEIEKILHKESSISMGMEPHFSSPEDNQLG